MVAVVIAGFFLIKKPQITQDTSGMPVPSTTGVEEKTVATDTEPVHEIAVSGDEYAFSPSSISAKKGEKVKLTFTNNGNLPHNLVINELGVFTKTIAPGQIDSIEFTAETDGSLEFYCSIGNHRTQGMEGTLEVK